MRAIFLTILAILLVLGGSAWWFARKNLYSKDVVRVEILGPAEVVAGEEVTYSVRYKNNGNVRLEEPVLVFEYPKGSELSGGERARTSKNLDALYPGQEGLLEFRSALFGKQGDLAQARAFLRYRPKNISAMYESETLFTTKIISVPLRFELELPQNAQKGQQFELVARMASLFEAPLLNVVLRIEYPEGFTQTKADPVPLTPKEWQIGALSPNREIIVRVQGVMTGDLESTKKFRGSLGTWKEGTFTELAAVERDVTLGKPSFSIVQLVNGEESPSVSAGETLRYRIVVNNTGDDALMRGTLEARLSGKAFDIESVQAAGGAVNRETQSILWGPDETPWMRSFRPGEDGAVEFSVKVKNPLPLASPLDKNLTLKTAVSFDASRRDFELKVNSPLAFSQIAYATGDIFATSGPFPPQALSATVYTVGWQIASPANDVSGVRARAILPQGVEFTGDVYPATSRVSFNSSTREITWEAGVVKAGSGMFSKALSMFFQVRLTPTPSQSGTFVPLIGQAKATGLDAFTLETLSASAPALDTSLPNDTAMSDNQKRVQ
ncbi:MAG: hypothetical protein HYW98_01515 [Candidatus Wildermuthbacteria bacterium]|nr:hypothetical protein [Candidatus Wildermuthbacteria bacterium]